MATGLNVSIQYLKGVGPKKAKVFNAIGIKTIDDLLYYFPRRYEDRSSFLPISKLEEGQVYTIRAKVLAVSQRQSFRRRGFSIVEIAVGDDSGKIFCVWFNQPYLKDYFQVGELLILYGKVERYAGRLQINSPEFENVCDDSEEALHIGRIVPIYALASKITQRNFRKMVKCVLDEYLPQIQDFLPYDTRSRNNLLNLAKSLLNIHFPQSLDLQKQAYARLSFEEFLLFQLPLVLRKLNKKKKQGIAHKVEGELVQDYISRLPFRFTAAQEKVIQEIKSDMAGPQPMQRLLQGDVGSGKTVVATLAAIFAIQGDYQVAFMVPTEILARQHYERISSQVGFACQQAEAVGRQIKITLLVSSLERKEKERVYQEVRSGEIDLVIGTHALLEEKVRFKHLGLVIIDEQHKFGVGQRALLPQKGITPDVLIMTATPIPRTLAIILYGDLDISVIYELPPGRKIVKTQLFKKKEETQAYELTRQQLRRGNQAYIVYPVIEESYALDIAGAQKMYAEFRQGEFKDFRLGLIHGRLKQEEQEKVMLGFQNKELDILVATTVLEVGIDIPSATCMIVQHAERFGLSQLHQLRGRIGRGAEESFCYLISDPQTEEAHARLEAMVNISDGFRIAEEDLKIRGPGEFFGRRQHGLSDLKIGNPLTQMQLLKRSREEAVRILAADARMEARQHVALKERLLQRFPEYKRYEANA